jgi:hypothetical protein
MAAWNSAATLSAQHQCGPQCNVSPLSRRPIRARPAALRPARRRRRLTRPAAPQVVREFGNLFRCTTSGAQHVCDRNCSQLIQWDKYSLICKVSRKIVPLDTTDTMAVEQDGGRRWAAARNRHAEHRRRPACPAVAWAAARGPPTAGSGASRAWKPLGCRPRPTPLPPPRCRKRNGDDQEVTLSPRRCGARKLKTDQQQWNLQQSGDAMVM